MKAQQNTNAWNAPVVMSQITIISQILIVVFSILFLVGLLVILAIAISNFKKKKVLPKHNSIRPKVSNISSNLTAIEDHLYLVPTPSHHPHKSSIEADQILNNLQRESPKLLRPTTAFRKDGGTKQRNIHMEYLPESNSVLKLELTENDLPRKITQSNFTIGEFMKKRFRITVHQGSFEDTLINVQTIKLRPDKMKLWNENKDNLPESQIGKITAHPRFLRFLGTCINSSSHEVFILSDYVAGVSLEELSTIPELEHAMQLNEMEKLQIVTDVTEAVSFLHNLSQPITHGFIHADSIIIDGETHRAKLQARETLETLNSVIDFEVIDVHVAPELMLQEVDQPNFRTDVWSATAVILEFLLDQKLWDFIGEEDNVASIKQAMEIKLQPLIIPTLMKVNSKLHFLAEGLSYVPDERPAMISMYKIFRLCLNEAKTMGKNGKSFIYPANEIEIISSLEEPLIKQQIEWNIRQERGKSQRALLFGNSNYIEQAFKSLSITPINDLRDMINLLQKSNFATKNNFENVASKDHLNFILKNYVECINKEPEEIDLLIFFYSGLAVKGTPKKILLKKQHGMFLDRVGILHDLALVMKDESLVAVSEIQNNLLKLTNQVKRIVMIMDCRVRSSRFRKFEWDLPVLAEASLERLPCMYTIFTNAEQRTEIIAMDSHPKRTNGFLTGCMVNLINQYPAQSPNIEDLSRLINSEMRQETRTARAFEGIECATDVVQVDHNIWMYPILGQSNEQQ